MSPKYGVNALGGMRYAVYKYRSADSIHVRETHEMDEEKTRQERRRAGKAEEARCVGWLQGAARCLLYKSCLELRENEKRECCVRNEGSLKQATKVKERKKEREKKKGIVRLISFWNWVMIYRIFGTSSESVRLNIALHTRGLK